MLVVRHFAIMMKTTPRLLLCLMMLMITPLSVARAASTATQTTVQVQESPAQIITGFEATLIEVMKNAGTLGYDGRYKKLDPVIRQVFDLPTMTRIVAGASWSGWTDAQQAAVTEAFTKFVISTYARRFDGYSGESFVTDGSQPQQNGIEVMTRLIQPTAAPVVLNYLLLQRPGAPWQIVDVYLTGSISELATRRSEFSAIIDQGGYQALLDALQAKTNDDPQP